MRIVFLGDSLTWGGYGGDFVAEIQDRCPQLEIINEGHGGNTVINLLRRIDTVLAHDPDGIFVMVGGNDALSSTQPATRPYYQQAQNIPQGIVTPAQFEQAYRDLLTRIQLNHTLVWIGLPPAEYSPPVVAAFQQMNDIARNVARAFNIETLDLMAHLLPPQIQARAMLTLKDINLIGRRTRSGWSSYEQERQAGDFTFTFDGFHLMPETARQIATLIVDFLNLC
jgi:lysophospholipase L1-like esterase